MKRYIFAIFFLFVVCVIPLHGAQATGEYTVTRIDTVTRTRGFELQGPEGAVAVSLRPNGAPATKMTITHVYDLEQAYREMPPPITHALASDVFTYDIEGVNTATIRKPFGIRFIPHESRRGLQFGFYDRRLQAWRLVPSSIQADGSIVASLQFPFAHIALLVSRPFSETDAVGPIRAAVVVDSEGRILYAKDTAERMPIASLTKLMTALVFLEHNPGWFSQVRMAASDVSEPVALPARPGDVYVAKDLFYAMIVGSRNNAAKALARATGLSETAFVAEMNKKARALGMRNTLFVDPTGLSPKNQSTADDYAKLAAIAFGTPDIGRAAGTREYVANRISPRAAITIRSTNKLLLEEEDFTVVAGKTGYIEEAGYNLAVQALWEGRIVTVVVFGAPTSAVRFSSARHLLERTFATRNSSPLALR